MNRRRGPVRTPCPSIASRAAVVTIAFQGLEFFAASVIITRPVFGLTNPFFDPAGWGMPLTVNTADLTRRPRCGRSWRNPSADQAQNERGEDQEEHPLSAHPSASAGGYRNSMSSG